MLTLSLIGNLTKDPEKKTTPSGKTYALFTVAVNRRNKRPTQFIRVKAWEELGDNCMKYLSRGRNVYVWGEMEDPYVFINIHGTPSCSMCVNAKHVEFIGGIDRSALSENKNNLPETATQHSEEEVPGDQEHNGDFDANDLGTIPPVIPTDGAMKKEYIPLQVDPEDLPF